MLFKTIKSLKLMIFQNPKKEFATKLMHFSDGCVQVRHSEELLRNSSGHRAEDNAFGDGFQESTVCRFAFLSS